MKRKVYILTGAADSAVADLNEDIYFVTTSIGKLRAYVVRWWGETSFRVLMEYGCIGNDVRLTRWTLDQDNLGYNF